MVEFFSTLAMLSSSFSMEAASLTTWDLSPDLLKLFLISTVFPILYRKHIDAFAQSNQLFSAFMDHLPAYAWIKDIDGNYVYVNNPVKTLPPFQLDWLGKTDKELWPSELSAIYRENDLKVIESGKTVETVESFLIDGEQRWLLVSRFPILDESGAVIMVGGTSVDITEHKRVEEALRESESFRRMIIESGPECVKLVAPDYTLLDMNPAGLEMIEATSLKEVIGESVLNLIAPECRNTFMSMHQRVCQGESAVAEFKVIGLKGAPRWMESHAVPLLDKESKVIAQLAITRDVSERRRAAKALRETEQKYRSIFENAVEGMFQTTPDGRFVAANPALARMLGFDSPEELMSTRTDIALEHYVAPESREEFKRSMETDGFVRDFELEAYRKDRTRIWVSENVRAVRDDYGKLIYYEGTTQDITGRKQAEEALRESEERYRDLVEHSLDLICTHDLDGMILSANRAAMEIMGYRSESYTGGANLREILSPEVSNQLDDYLNKIRADGAASGLMVVQTKTGEKRIWEYRNTLRTQGVAAPVVRGMARDITEERRANHSLRLFRTLMDHSTDAINVIDPDTLRFLDCNKSAYQDLGYSREEFLTLSVYDIDPLADESMAARIRQQIEGSGFVMFESLHRRKDGSTFPVEVNLKPVRLDRDYRLAVVRDITERKVAEEALRQAEQKYRRIFENASEGIFQSTPEGKLTAANPSLARMYGFNSPEEMIRSYNDLSQQMYVDPLRRQEFRNLLETHHVVRDFEYEVLRKDGKKIWVSLNSRVVRDEEGAVCYYEGTAQDITYRKLAEEALNESRRYLQALFDNSLDGILVTNNEAHYTDANPAACAMLGYSREELMKRRILDVTAPQFKQQGRAMWQEFLAKGSQSGEYATLRKDGSVVQLEYRAVANILPGVHVSSTRDVTERKRAEEAKREAVQKYRDIFENALEGIFQISTDGRYVVANPALARMFGYDSTEELISESTDTSKQLYVDRKRREDFKRQLEEHGVVKAFELQAYRKDGSTIWLSENARAVRDECGEVLYYEGTAQDITDRKQAEDDLIKQKEILQQIVDHIPVMINFTGSDGRIKLVNREWQQTLGWSLEEILNENLDAFAECYPDPKDRREVLSFMAAATGDWGDFKTRTRDGHLLDTSWARIKLSDGTTIGIGQDITARKRAEQALRQAEQKYRELFENAKDAIYVHDLSGKYTSINLAAEKLSGYSRAEILGKDFRNFVAFEYAEQVRENLCQKLRHEGETTYEVEVTTKDGRRVPVEVSSRLIYEDGVPVAVQGTARNIAERKRAEEALRVYSMQLIRAQEAERESIARELHDQIGQVLTAVRINLETIRGSSNRAESDALIDEGVAIVDEAIQQVRDLSFELRPSLLNDLGLTAALRWFADRYAQRTGIQTKTTICPESRIRLARELETACFRIVQEALTNVARHAHAKNVSIDVRTVNGALSLSVKDDGVGFNFHSQTNGALLNRLGLRGMEERAHELGAILEIESTSHQGTEVRVHFPNGSKKKS